MKEWYIILEKRDDLYQPVATYFEIDGRPVSEPQFYESLEDAKKDAEALALEEYEIYQKVIK